MSNARTVAAAIELYLQLTTSASRISEVVALAQSQGRDELTDAEWAVIDADGAAARASLVDAIAQAKAEGR